VDAKDFRLLVMLNENARQSFHALGRRLSLSAPAIRERLRRLERRGIVQGYWVAMDPAIFGRKDLLVSFDKEWSREDALRAAVATDVAWVAWKVDGGLTVQLWPQHAARAVEGLARFVGREPNWHAFTDSLWKGNVSGLDWRILDALIDAPLASIGMLSDTTGLSPKTVRNRLAGLIRSEAIFVVPRLGLPTDSGVLVYNLVVSGTAPFAEVKHRIGDAVLIHETGGTPPRKYLFCRADSLGELTSTMQTLERLPGVSAVQLTLNREMIIQMDFVHRLAREMMQERGPFAHARR
jgi:DNA-binding Lrp family transcriptional regulator